MGMFSVDMEVSPLEGAGSVTVRATVDSGATFCMAPRSVLEQAGLVPTDTAPFELADGSVITRPICYARISVADRKGISVVVFGEENEPRLLGVVALESMLLAIDPAKQRLVPTEAILYKATVSFQDADGQEENL